jgi:hypothetical protein
MYISMDPGEKKLFIFIDKSFRFKGSQNMKLLETAEQKILF